MSAASTRSNRGRRAINDINMVPFIDVMLVLLIIFMVTAPLIAPSVIDVPSVGKGAQQPAQFIQVLIDRQERIDIQTNNDTSTKRPAELRELPGMVMQLQGGKTDTPVVISADKSIKYETVVKVMDSLQRAGVQRVGLSVQLQP